MRGEFMSRLLTTTGYTGETGGDFLGEPEGAISTAPPILQGILTLYKWRGCFLPEMAFTGQVTRMT